MLHIFKTIPAKNKMAPSRMTMVTVLVTIMIVTILIVLFATFYYGSVKKLRWNP